MNETVRQALASKQVASVSTHTDLKNDHDVSMIPNYTIEEHAAEEQLRNKLRQRERLKLEFEKGNNMASDTTMMVDIDKNACQSIQGVDIKPRWTKQFPVIGKGTFLFNIARSMPFYIAVCRQGLNDDLKSKSWIGLTVTKERVSFLSKVLGEEPKTLCEATSSKFFGNNIGIEPDFKCTYWLSYDRDRMVIKYGKGYRMEKTTILEYNFEHLEKDKRKVIRRVFFDPKVDRDVELYDEQPWETSVAMTLQGTNSKTTIPMTAIDNVEKEVDFEPMPIVSDLSYIVKDSSTVNLFDLDSGKYIYSASLPPECQVLYDNITAGNVDLDYEGTDPENQYDFKLSDAIRYSIETEGCSLNKKLKDKESEFGTSDPTETYLRVTLGKDRGNSPGIPYVLELWPKKHGSPIHNHGNSYAVIRVLHGGLTIKYYNKASVSNIDDSTKKPEELGNFSVKKGDLTWISPNWYQTHKLWNFTDDFCATIQCYQYGNSDYMNWPYFDYIKTCDIIGEFTPDSDYTFTEMYNRVMKEYANRPQGTKARQRGGLRGKVEV